MDNEYEVARPGASTGAVRAEFGPRAHMCALFSSEEEQYAIALPFIKEGLLRGDKAFHTLDPERVSEHLRWLESADIDIEHFSRSKQLEYRTWKDVYLPDGAFKPEFSNAVFQDVGTRAHEQGYESVSFVADMGWIQPGDVDDILLNEARWTQAAPHMPPCHVICMYDLRKFRGDVVLHVMRTHPQVIVNGTVHVNPFFVPPDQFIREIDEQGRRRIGQ